MLHALLSFSLGFFSPPVYFSHPLDYEFTCIIMRITTIMIDRIFFFKSLCKKLRNISELSKFEGISPILVIHFHISCFGDAE